MTMFNASKPIDQQRAIEKLKFLIKHEKVFELTEKRVTKTYPQLKYLHLILAYFALEFGEKTEYIKIEFFKKIANRDLFEFEFVNRKTAEVRTELRSCAELTKDQMTLAIDRFRDYASKEAGIYLPQPNDLSLIDIEIEINNNKQWL